MREKRESTLLSLFGAVLFYLSMALLLPIGVSLYYGEDAIPYLYPLLAVFSIALVMIWRYRPADTVYATEALFAVAVGWLVVAGISAVPFILQGFSPIDGLFESMSGLTTTGATVLAHIEAAPKALLFWRSLIQWLGGAGILLVFVAVLPSLKIGGRQLFKGEFPGHEVQDIRFRISHTARIFFCVYLVFSVVFFLMLVLARVGVYDALCIVFSTLSTGGFSPHTQSIAYYHSAVVEWLVIVFMFLSGANFYTHYRGLYEHPINYLKSTEFKAYSIIVLAATAVAWLAIELAHPFQLSALRYAAFQVISLLTTTGFTTTDYGMWPLPLKVVLLMLMVIGGSTGSTGGGIKVARALISMSFIRLTVHKLIHPSAVIPVKFDGRAMPEGVLSSVAAFVIAYAGLIAVSVLLLVLTGIGASDALSATIATLGNVGPGFGGVGPASSYAWLSDEAKLILVFNMWAGRLELFTVFVIFFPSFWRELFRDTRRRKV
ncbi:MAG: TrkH family potassium uptake protein [Methermicoccaceae archaeon]